MLLTGFVLNISVICELQKKAELWYAGSSNHLQEVLYWMAGIWRIMLAWVEPIFPIFSDGFRSISQCVLDEGTAVLLFRFSEGLTCRAGNVKGRNVQFQPHSWSVKAIFRSPQAKHYSWWSRGFFLFVCFVCLSSRWSKENLQEKHTKVNTLIHLRKAT